MGTPLFAYRPLWTDNLLAKRRRAAYGGPSARGQGVVPELDRLLEQARGGDTVVVWRLDRLGGSLCDNALVSWSRTSSQVSLTASA